jgi:3-oxoacyl-[acyl-carrier protein] reductase
MVRSPDDTTYADRVAIVTGGSRGIGRKVVRRLASLGYAVVVNYASDKSAPDAAVEEILAGNGIALAVRADVADELDVERLFIETTKAFGGVDVVVHTAGHRILGAYDLNAIDAVQRPNVRGIFIVNRQAAREVREGGAIVNFSGPVGRAFPTDAACAPNNNALEAITAGLAREVVDGTSQSTP